VFTFVSHVSLKVAREVLVIVGQLHQIVQFELEIFPFAQLGVVFGENTRVGLFVYHVYKVSVQVFPLVAKQIH
jgi:hypothetical protein